MFAVIRTGGKQYKVAKDDVIEVERLEGEAGAKITFGEVLMVGADKGAPKTGTPLVAGATVEAELVETRKDEKVVAFKKKRRKNTHRKRGHRQIRTKVRITEIRAS